MKFIDPFPARCEFCGTKSRYPVDGLLAYRACCSGCGTQLVDVPSTMHASIREHRVFIWPMMFLWEVVERFDLDLDQVSEEEMDGILSIGDLKEFLGKFGLAERIAEVLDLPIIERIRNDIDASALERYTLEELALMAHPERRPG